MSLTLVDHGGEKMTPVMAEYMRMKREAYIRYFVLAAEVAKHLGKDTDGSPSTDPDVLAFIEKAVRNEIAAESQQVKALDAMDLEV